MAYVIAFLVACLLCVWVISLFAKPDPDDRGDDDDTVTGIG